MSESTEERLKKIEQKVYAALTLLQITLTGAATLFTSLALGSDIRFAAGTALGALAGVSFVYRKRLVVSTER